MKHSEINSTLSGAEYLIQSVDLSDIFCYDESSPSGLIFKCDRTTFNGKRIIKKAGDNVGTILSAGKKKYWQTTLNRHPLRVHRIIAKMFLVDYSENLLINHIDGNGLNNKLSNLEVVDNKGNSNRMLCHTTEALFSNNTSGVNGITFLNIPNGSKNKVNTYVEANCVVDGIKKRKKMRYSTQMEKEAAILEGVLWREKMLKEATEAGLAFYR